MMSILKISNKQLVEIGAWDVWLIMNNYSSQTVPIVTKLMLHVKNVSLLSMLLLGTILVKLLTYLFVDCDRKIYSQFLSTITFKKLHIKKSS